MTSVLNFFETDFSHTATKRYEFGIFAESTGRRTNMIARAHIDFTAHVLFSSFYFPAVEGMDILGMCDGALAQRAYLFDLKGAGEFRLPASESLTGSGIRVERNDPLIIVTLEALEGGSFDTREFGVAPVTYIYGDEALSESRLGELRELGKRHDTVIRYRGPTYVEERSRFARPKAFISHDSRDGAIARDIAIGLSQMGHHVWFSEFSLKPGDRLRQSIEKGIKECKRCIVVLTPNFVSNTGWAATEFESIFAREIHERNSLVLPVWAGVTPDQIFEYSPSLKNIFAAEWLPDDKQQSIRNLARGLAD
jgi:hypothetical protein